MSGLRAVPTQYTITRTADHPLFGESAVVVAVADEGGGPFIELSDEVTDKPMRIDLDELREVLRVGEQMVRTVERCARGAK